MVILENNSVESFFLLYLNSNPDHVTYDIQTTAEMLIPDISRFMLNRTDIFDNTVSQLITSIVYGYIIMTAMTNGLELDRFARIGDEDIKSPVKMPKVSRLDEIVIDINSMSDKDKLINSTYCSMLNAFVDTIYTKVNDVTLKRSTLLLSNIVQALNYGIKEANNEL